MTETARPMPQGVPFLLYCQLTGEICGKRSHLALPFFALSKTVWMTPPA